MDFELWVPIQKSEAITSGPYKGGRVIRGIATDESPDLDGERVIASRFPQAFTYLEKHGMVNLDHGPDDIGHVSKLRWMSAAQAKESYGHLGANPQGNVIEAEVMLWPIKDEKHLALAPAALKKAHYYCESNAPLGFSIQGSVKERTLEKSADGEDEKIAVPGLVNKLALTTQPKNSNAVAQIVKSLAAVTDPPEPEMADPRDEAWRQGDPDTSPDTRQPLLWMGKALVLNTPIPDDPSASGHIPSEYQAAVMAALESVMSKAVPGGTTPVGTTPVGTAPVGMTSEENAMPETPLSVSVSQPIGDYDVSVVVTPRPTLLQRVADGITKALASVPIIPTDGTTGGTATKLQDGGKRVAVEELRAGVDGEEDDEGDEDTEDEKRRKRMRKGVKSFDAQAFLDALDSADMSIPYTGAAAPAVASAIPPPLPANLPSLGDMLRSALSKGGDSHSNAVQKGDCDACRRDKRPCQCGNKSEAKAVQTKAPLTKGALPADPVVKQPSVTAPTNTGAKPDLTFNQWKKINGIPVTMRGMDYGASPEHRKVIAAAINKYGTGNHPVSSPETVDDFSAAYVQHCLARMESAAKSASAGHAAAVTRQVRESMEQHARANGYVKSPAPPPKGNPSPGARAAALSHTGRVRRQQSALTSQHRVPNGYAQAPATITGATGGKRLG